jgi:hypothetical protein
MKNWGREKDKSYVKLNSPSHMYGLISHYISSGSPRVPEKLLSLPSLEGSNLVSIK